MTERRPSEVRYDITITIHLPEREEPRIEMAYRGVSRADAMAQPALAAAVVLFEDSEPAPAAVQTTHAVDPSFREIRQHRRFPRHHLRLPIKVTPLASGQPVWGESEVVGEGGMGATLSQDLAESEVVTIAIGAEGSGPLLQIRGMVRNHAGPRHGFAFFALSEQERTELRRILGTGGERRRMNS